MLINKFGDESASLFPNQSGKGSALMLSGQLLIAADEKIAFEENLSVLGLRPNFHNTPTHRYYAI